MCRKKRRRVKMTDRSRNNTHLLKPTRCLSQPAFMSLNEALDERVPPRDLLNTFEVDDVHGVELLYSLTTAEPDDDQAIAAARAKAKAKAKAEARGRAAAAREEAQMADAVAS